MCDLAASKKQLRTRLRAQRRELDSALLSEKSAQICTRLLQLPQLQEAQRVFCYVSCGGEVETHDLIRQLLAVGKIVAVPRCRENGVMDCVPISSLEQLVPGKMGILEPPKDFPSISAAQIDFAVVPAVACGEDGSRLGQGGGYYDRFLERSDCAYAAVCLEVFLLPEVPCEPHDKKMKMIVTSQRVLRFEEL